MNVCTVYKLTIQHHSYFGYTTEYHNRTRRHKQDLEGGKHHNIVLQRAWNKYEVIDFEVLEEGLTKTEAHELEKKLIAENECVNIARGGDGGDTISRHPNRSSIVAKISKNHKSTYSDEWKDSQGRISQRGDVVWSTYHCSVCDRDIKGKGNFSRYHGENCGRPQKKIECPHCGKIGSGGGMYNKHLDKCKYKL